MIFLALLVTSEAKKEKLLVLKKVLKILIRRNPMVNEKAFTCGFFFIKLFTL